VFTNDALFAKLGLKVPQTFAQLLSLCRKASAAGTPAFILAGNSQPQVTWLIDALAVSTLYAQESQWTRDLKAGKVTFDGTPGWHEAMQEFIDMNQAGCFEPGMTGVTSSAAAASFAQAQALMYGTVSSFGAMVAADQPQFAYSFHPFPGGATPTSTTTFLNLSPMFAINAHSSPQNQAAAREFIDFMARPAQDAFFEKLSDGFTEYEFLKGQIPGNFVGFGPILANHEWVVNPAQTWWNTSVNSAFGQEAIGLVTGQVTIDDVLNAMDAAWKQGRG
jgi:raffinose/stachyose/melibiose transport system substrate-binding protein